MLADVNSLPAPDDDHPAIHSASASECFVILQFSPSWFAVTSERGACSSCLACSAAARHINCPPDRLCCCSPEPHPPPGLPAVGTGSAALSLAMFPYPFPGQLQIGWAIWALNVLLFVTFSTLMLARLVKHPGSMLELLHHPVQSMFLPTVPMSWTTITQGVILFWVPTVGSGAALVAHAMFW